MQHNPLTLGMERYRSVLGSGSALPCHRFDHHVASFARRAAVGPRRPHSALRLLARADGPGSRDFLSIPDFLSS
jgi:hypothetical protein